MGSRTGLLQVRTDAAVNWVAAKGAVRANSKPLQPLTHVEAQSTQGRIACTATSTSLPAFAGKDYANTAFSCLVILECAVKLAAMGPRLYWRSNWNKFDLALALAAAVDILTQASLRR